MQDQLEADERMKDLITTGRIVISIDHKRPKLPQHLAAEIEAKMIANQINKASFFTLGGKMPHV